MVGIKYKDSKLNDFIQCEDIEFPHCEDNIGVIHKKLLLFLYSIPSERQKNITSIQKLNFFAQFEGLMPFIPKTINHYGAYSSDIEYLKNDLINEGYLKKESYKYQRITDYFSKENEFIVLNIPFDIQRKISLFAEQVNIDLNDYKSKVGEFCKKHEKDTNALGKESKIKFLETIKELDNHIFLDKSIIDEKLTEKFKINGIDTFGIEGIFKLPILQIFKTDRTPAEIVGGIASEIINNKERLSSSHFNIRSIHGNFHNNCGKINLIGTPVFLVGHFKSCYDHDSGYITKFCDSTVKPKEHEIDIIIGKNGNFCQNRTIEDIKTNECIVIGRLDEKAGKPIILVVGIIRIDTLPLDYMWDGKNHLE